MSWLDLFRIAGFSPHISCISSSSVIVMHVLGDALVAGAYFLIPISVFLFVSRRGKGDLNPLLVWTGLFILFCGLSHVMAIAVLWWPAYVLEAWVKILTGIISWVALVQLVPMLSLMLAGGQRLHMVAEVVASTDQRAIQKYRERDILKAMRLKALARELSRYAESMDVEIAD